MNPTIAGRTEVKLLSSVLVFSVVAMHCSGQAAHLQGSLSAASSTEASSFIDALLKTASRFRVPLAVEWMKSPDTLKPVRLPENAANAPEAFDAIVSPHTDYAWQIENGVVHVFATKLLNDPRNLLNTVVSELPDRSWTVRAADNFLFQSIGQAVRLTGPKSLSISPAGNESQLHLAGHNARVREVLNQIITASKMNIWITTFPNSSAVTNRGFWETVPMYDSRGIKPEDQPFWIFLRWGDIPWKRLETPEP